MTSDQRAFWTWFGAALGTVLFLAGVPAAIYVTRAAPLPKLVRPAPPPQVAATPPSPAPATAPANAPTADQSIFDYGK